MHVKGRVVVNIRTFFPLLNVLLFVFLLCSVMLPSSQGPHGHLADFSILE